MLATVAEVSIALAPFAVIAGLLYLAERRSRRRAERHARQIRLTDAIHEELGAVAAPVVTRGARGAWSIRIAIPLDRPDIVGTIVRITDRVFSEHRDEEPVRIVLTAREPEALRRGPRQASSGPVLRRPAAAVR